MEQLFINLLINARDAIEEKWESGPRVGEIKEITLQTRSEDGFVVDPTLGWDQDAEYYGVAFSTEDMAARIIKNGYYGLFSDDWTISDLVLGLDQTFKYQGPETSTLSINGD